MRRFEHIGLIRVVASFFVMAFHFSNFNREGEFLFSEEIRIYFEPLMRSVEVFFIISGFVMWHYLHVHEFDYSKVWTFLKKRIIRVIPLYWLTIALICLVNLVWARSFPFPLQQIVENAFFLVGPISNSTWINPLFNTLQIEVLFYLGLTFLGPIFYRFKELLYLLIILLIVLSYNNLSSDFIQYLPFFLFGIFVYQQQINRIKIINYLGIFCIFGLIIWKYATIDLITLLLLGILLNIRFKTNKFIDLLGEASYALYLTHGLVGGSFIFVGMKIPLFQKYTVILIGMSLIISILFALAVHLWVEKPLSEYLKRKWLS